MNEYEMVFCKHYRPAVGGSIDMATGRMRREYRPRGGATVVVLKDPATARLHIGVSICSKKDNFCRRVGRFRAMARAELAAQKGVMMAYPQCRPTENFSVKALLASMPDRVVRELLETTKVTV